jgi:hypothetical protein
VTAIKLPFMSEPSRLFLLCESCGVCRQHLLSIPKNTQSNALSAAKCVTCGKTIWIRVKSAGPDSASPLAVVRSLVRSRQQGRAAATESASASSPRKAALTAYAQRAIEHRSRALDVREKGSLLPGLEAVRTQTELRYELRLAKKRLGDYAPDPGREHCPKCHVFHNENVPLSYQRDPAVPGKSAIVTCSSCGFIGSIPSL